MRPVWRLRSAWHPGRGRGRHPARHRRDRWRPRRPADQPLARPAVRGAGPGGRRDRRAEGRDRGRGRRRRPRPRRAADRAAGDPDQRRDVRRGHRPDRAALLAPEPGTDRPAAGGAGRGARRPRPRRHRPGQPGPVRQREGADPGRPRCRVGQVSVGILTTTVAGQAAKALSEVVAHLLGVLAVGVPWRCCWRAAQAGHVRPGAPRDRLAAAGAGGDAARHPGGCRRRGPVRADRPATTTPGSCSTYRPTSGRPCPRWSRPAGWDVVTGRSRAPTSWCTTDPVLVVNRCRSSSAPRPVGSVVTFQDRTELDA